MSSTSLDVSKLRLMCHFVHGVCDVTASSPLCPPLSKRLQVHRNPVLKTLSQLLSLLIDEGSVTDLRINAQTVFHMHAILVTHWCSEA